MIVQKFIVYYKFLETIATMIVVINFIIIIIINQLNFNDTTIAIIHRYLLFNFTNLYYFYHNYIIEFH